MSGVITLRPADGAHERKRRMRGAAPGEPFASSGAQRGNVPRVGRRGRATVAGDCPYPRGGGRFLYSDPDRNRAIPENPPQKYA